MTKEQDRRQEARYYINRIEEEDGEIWYEIQNMNALSDNTLIQFHGANAKSQADKCLEALQSPAPDEVDFENAKEIMKGAFVPDYDEDGIEHQKLWMQVTDELGIYPKAVVKEGIRKERTEWQNGWNAAVLKATSRMCDLLRNAKPAPVVDVFDLIREKDGGAFLANKGIEYDLDADLPYEFFGAVFDFYLKSHLTPKQEWRPIETAPKDGTWFLYMDNRGFMSSAFTEDGKSFYGDHHSSPYGNELQGLLKWRPLPEPPTKEQNNDIFKTR